MDFWGLPLPEFRTRCYEPIYLNNAGFPIICASENHVTPDWNGQG